MNHTTTPWVVNDYTGEHKDGYTIFDCGGFLNMDEDKANAKFIVKAVNNHDLLVNTLKEVNKVLSDNDTFSDEEGEGFNNTEIMRLESIIIDVLKKIGDS